MQRRRGVARSVDTGGRLIGGRHFQVGAQFLQVQVSPFELFACETCRPKYLHSSDFNWMNR